MSEKAQGVLLVGLFATGLLAALTVAHINF